MDWQQLLLYITGSVEQELLRRNEYLMTENQLLRKQIQGRVRLTDAERTTLAELGKRLGKLALEEIATIVKPETILAWHRISAPYRRRRHAARAAALTVAPSKRLCGAPSPRQGE